MTSGPSSSADTEGGTATGLEANEERDPLTLEREGDAEMRDDEEDLGSSQEFGLFDGPSTVTLPTNASAINWNEAIEQEKAGDTDPVTPGCEISKTGDKRTLSSPADTSPSNSNPPTKKHQYEAGGNSTTETPSKSQANK